MNPLIGAQRWKIRKLQKKLDEEHKVNENQLRERYEKQRKQILSKIHHVHNKIFLAIRCSSPSFHPRHEELIMDYCLHYMKTSVLEYPHLHLFQHYNQRYSSTPLQKNCEHVFSLCENLKLYCSQRDQLQIKFEKDKQSREDFHRIKEDNQLRWAVDKSLDNGLSKIKYWTLWFLATHNLLREAKHMLATDSHWRDDVDKRDPDYGFTALHYASKYGHADFMKLLIEHGADVIARIPDGRTCLHLAATYSGASAVDELVVHGARTDDRDSFGLTPLDLARQNNNLPATRALQKWSSLPEEALRPDLHTRMPASDEQELVVETGKSKSVGLRLLEARVSGLESREAEQPSSSAALRLLEKHACLSLAEGFREEALESLLLRWHLAKKLLFETPNQLPLSSCLKTGEELVDFCVHDNNLRSAMVYLDECIDLLREKDDLPEGRAMANSLWSLLNRRIELCVSLSRSDDSFLAESLSTIHRALEMASRLFDFSLGEPMEVVSVVRHEIDVLERMGRLSEAAHRAAALATIPRRHLGALHPQTISLKLDHIRLLMMAVLVNNEFDERRDRQVAFVCSVAEDLLSETQDLNPDNAEAFGLLKRCAEYVAAAQLLKNGSRLDLYDALRSQMLSKASLLQSMDEDC